MAQPTTEKDEPSTCTGVAASCYNRVAGTCSTQDGCAFVQHVRYDGSLTYDCEGSSTSCDRLTTEGACERQEGCRWQ